MATRYEPIHSLDDYSVYHKKRFQYLMEAVKTHAPDQNKRILEIGRGPFTKTLTSQFKNVTTLGLPLDKAVLSKEGSQGNQLPHVVFDLKDCQFPTQWPQMEPFDLIVFAEVLEHLYIAPELIFQFLNQALKPDGILICQTPNGVSIHKRLWMLLGIPPTPPWGFDLFEPGHFREYTKSELLAATQRTGFEVKEHSFQSYFAANNRASACLDFIANFVPSWRRGQTLVLQKKSLPMEDFTAKVRAEYGSEFKQKHS